MRYYVVRWRYTFDPKHGFGILFGQERNNRYEHCFYEDGTLESGELPSEFERQISTLKENGTDERRLWQKSRTDEAFTRLMTGAECRFTAGKEGTLHAQLKSGKESQKVSVKQGKNGWGFSSFVTSCSCESKSCLHIRAAADFMNRRLKALQHAYVVTDQPVDKSMFLEDELEEKTRNLHCQNMDPETMEEIREIIRLVDSANSEAYYLRYHDYLLGMSPIYYESRFLEEEYAELLAALFEDPGYKKALLDSGIYAEKEEYEEQQYRSNRACVKRVLKDYQRAAKALAKGDYQEDTYSEFLLKYRNDLKGLLRYFAEGKETLTKSDLPYLKIIAEEAGDAELIGAVAEKLDAVSGQEGVEETLRSLLEHLPGEKKIEIYSRLRNISMAAEDIRTLGREEQLRMIRNTPLDEKSFCHIMDDLMAGSSAEEQGRFILFAVQRARLSGNKELKKVIAQRAARLPDSRLLVKYILERLSIREKVEGQTGTPEREMSAYFGCRYEIERSSERMYADFTIFDPESDAILLNAREIDGTLRMTGALSDGMGYTPEIIREVCLKGHETEYEDAFEQNRDALAIDLFEQKNAKFAKGYKTLCESLADEKILYTEAGKVRIEWLIYRDQGSSALAFRVGHSRMYIVKDAMEFLAAFRKGTTTEYGKDLILTHDPANLEEADAEAIRRLTTAKYTKGRKSETNNKRYITVSSALLSDLIETLAGRTVYFNEVPCTIRLKERKIRLKIDGKYALNLQIDRNQQEFLNLQGRGYLLEHGKGQEGDTLDRVEGTPEEINLLSLVQENPSVSIKPILRDFRKNIYSRFFESFDVDRKVERDFTLSPIRLNTYFDYEKGVISARTEILKDEKVISREKLTDRIDRVKVELLDNYLGSIGFEEGRLADESRVLAFFKMDFTRLKTLTNVYLADSLKNKELKTVGKPVIRVLYQNNLVRVFLEKSEYTEAELEQIIAGLRKKRKYILLDGDRIVDLDSEAARDFGEAVKDFGMDPADLYREKTVSMINAIKAFSHERSCRVDQYLRDMIEEIRGFKEAEMIPPQLASPLRDYQAEGFRWLSVLAKYNMGGILADDMGLGKTIQMIALLKSDSSRKPSLVVCPKSLIFNWMSEFARFDGSTRVTAVYGTDSQRSKAIAAISWKKKEVYVTSYDSLRIDIEKYKGEFNYVILDEAQYIKNVNAQKTRSVKELKAVHRFAMTGTPIENSVVDLWSIFDFIMPGYFEELSRFRDSDPAAIARKAAPFILRRVKEDVLEDLPAKYERILSAEMTEGQRGLYDAMRMEARKALEEGGKAFDLLPYLTRLRQVCVDPGMFAENYRGGSGKMAMLAELIPEYLEAGHRILIFSQFVKALDSVKKILDAKRIDTYYLTGATPAKERIRMMDSFNNGSGTDVFLISLKAGGTGLNLTGADTVIHLDPWWNVAAENQASDRTHRIGQTRNVEVIKLIAGESIEQRVLELQDIKKEVIRQVISDDDGSVTSASLEDIAFVLE